MSTEQETFEGWAILELMGHRRLAGYVREVELAGHGVLRLEVPKHELQDTGTCARADAGEGAPADVEATQFYSPAALYCLTPTTEEIARALAARSRPQPVQQWELPPARVYVPDEADVEEPGDEPPF